MAEPPLISELHAEVRNAVGYKGPAPSLKKGACAISLAYTEVKNQYKIERGTLGVFIVSAVLLIILRALLAFAKFFNNNQKLKEWLLETLYENATAAYILLALGAFTFLLLWSGVEAKRIRKKRLQDLFDESAEDGALQAMCKKTESLDGGGVFGVMDIFGDIENNFAEDANDLADTAKAVAGQTIDDKPESDKKTEDKPTEEENAALLKKIRTGLLQANTTNGAAVVSKTIGALRDMIGAVSFREPDDTDFRTMIVDIIVPLMIEARMRMLTADKDAGGGGVGGGVGGATATSESCSDECSATASGILKSFEGGADVSAAALEKAWDDCPSEMRDVCGKLKLAKDRCAAMCNGTKGDVRRLHSVLGYAPNEESWTLHADAKSAADCWKASTTSHDAAMYVRVDGPTGAAKCYLHEESSIYQEFLKKPGAVATAQVKQGSPMVLPGNDPAVVAEAIVEAIKGSSMTIDISGHGDAILAELRRQAVLTSSSIDADLPWYQDCIATLTAILSSADVSDRGKIPSAGMFNRALDGMTAQDFRDRIIWPLFCTDTFIQVRRDSAPSLDTWNRRSRLYHVIVVGGIASALVIGAVLLFPDIRNTRFVEIGRKIHDNVSLIMLYLLALTIVWTQFRYWRRKNEINRSTRKENTEILLQRSAELRDAVLSFLPGSSAILKTLAGPQTDSAAAQAAQAADAAALRNLWKTDDSLFNLRASVFAGDISVIPSFPDDSRSTPVLRILSVKQRNILLLGCVRFLEAYDICNDASDRDSLVTFPVSDVALYSFIAAYAIGAVIYMYTQVDGEEMFNSTKRVQAAIEAAKLGRPGAVSLLRTERLSGYDESTAYDTIVKVARYVFAASVTIVMLLLINTTKTDISRLENAKDCAE
jgi:hypothetical protein